MVVEEAGKPQRLELAGLLLGSMLWMKDEGWILLAAVMISWLLLLLCQREGIGDIWNKTKWLIAGILPMMLVTLLFKWQLAPANNMITHLGKGGLDGLVDFSRYITIGKAMIGQFFSFGNVRIGLLPLVLFLLFIVGSHPLEEARPEWYRQGIAMLLAIGAYFGTYLLTPYDLSWHLDHSLSRLFAQLVPSVILLALAVVAEFPEETVRK